MLTESERVIVQHLHNAGENFIEIARVIENQRIVPGDENPLVDVIDSVKG